jgi:hypothetical protein
MLPLGECPGASKPKMVRTEARKHALIPALRPSLPRRKAPLGQDASRAMSPLLAIFVYIETFKSGNESVRLPSEAWPASFVLKVCARGEPRGTSSAEPRLGPKA